MRPFVIGIGVTFSVCLAVVFYLGQGHKRVLPEREPALDARETEHDRYPQPFRDENNKASAENISPSRPSATDSSINGQARPALPLPVLTKNPPFESTRSKRDDAVDEDISAASAGLAKSNQPISEMDVSGLPGTPYHPVSDVVGGAVDAFPPPRPRFSTSGPLVPLQ